MLKLFLRLLFLFSLGRYTDCQEAKMISEKQPEQIVCDIQDPSTVLWFCIGNTGMDIIGFVDVRGDIKPTPTVTGVTVKNKTHIEIKEFNKARDSGVYGCSTISGQNLIFGSTTTLTGPADPTTTITPRVTTATPPSTTATPCDCKTVRRSQSPADCEVAIWAPLVVGCILLFLLLILTIRHCSRVRTRGCPHHYKRRPRNPAQLNLGKPGRYS